MISTSVDWPGGSPTIPRICAAADLFRNPSKQDAGRAERDLAGTLFPEHGMDAGIYWSGRV